MVAFDAPLNKKKFPLSLDGLPFDSFMGTSVHKGSIAHTHYLISGQHPSAMSFRVDLQNMVKFCKPCLENAQTKLSLPADEFPYRLTESQWWQYALSPHSYLPVGDGQYQIGLNYFNRFLHLDLHHGKARLFDPGIGDDFLSTTNSFNVKTGHLWFASWPAFETLRRNLNPSDKVQTTIWRLTLRNGEMAQIWRGNLGDSLHQLSVSPDQRYLVLAELGLRPENPALAGQAKITPSSVLVLDLKTRQEWRLALPCAAHVEYDPDDPAVCYLSGHNIGLIGAKVGIFGRALIHKVRLTASGPEIIGTFTHSCFYRITTHIIFRSRQKTLIAASGYPGHLFIIDAKTMQLSKILEMESSDRVNTARTPHVCQQDSYGITASRDGRYLLISGSGFIKVVDLTTDSFILDKKIKDYEENSCFTGHLGTFCSASGKAS